MEKNSVHTSSNESAESHGQKKTCPGLTGFFVGLVAALVVGWWFFPKVLYSEQAQPIQFSHVAHVEMGGMMCEDCHFSREDGTYHGLPTTEECASCHMGMMGDTEAERIFVEDYVEREREVEWLVYQYQPDNVFFSHAAHSIENCNMCHDYEENQLCIECHPNVAESESAPIVKKNLLTGYTPQTMKMDVCEHCHAHPDHMDMTNASNACFVCHK